MRDKKSEVQDIFEDLFIKVYLCGYENEGESSVFVMYSNRPKPKILYMAVIDCFDDGTDNCTIKILEKLNDEFNMKKNLDMLIWTHPHDDHTKGIEKIIKKYCDKNTKIVSANILNSSIDVSETCKNVIKCINDLNYNQKKRWNISSIEKMGDILQIIKYTGNLKLLKEMRIKCISPCPDILSQKIVKDSINDLSIGIIIEIRRDDGNLNFLFASDMECKTIREVIREQEDEEIPNRFDYIKIPHHGGKSGELIVELLDEDDKSQFAASTIYSKTMKDGKSYNPDIDVLKNYHRYVNEISLTTDIFNDVNGIGVIRVTYDLSNKTRSIETFGQAKRNVV